jgi:hypothetical protein
MSKIKEQGMKYNLYSWSAQKKIDPIVITKAEGVYFWDEDGNKYYDMSAQMVNLNLGHGNKELIQAIKDQAEKMAYISPGYSVDVRSEAAQKIVELSGLEGAKVFFVNAGAEANENAMKFAKAYTGKWKFFAAYRSYHGSSFGSSSLTGEPRKFIAEPAVPGVIHFDGPYAYRAPKACKFDSEEDITEFYLELLENQILYEGPEQIAGIFFETVVGTNGVLIPPKGYYEGVRALCDKYNILLILDEVMTGFYRTGIDVGDIAEMAELLGLGQALIYSIEQSDLPMMTIILRKGTAAAHYVLGGPTANENNAFTLGTAATEIYVMHGETAAAASYARRLVKDKDAGKPLDETIEKMNVMIKDYHEKSRPDFCAKQGFVDEVVNMPDLRKYCKAFVGAYYQNPKSICPIHQMITPRTIKG